MTDTWFLRSTHASSRAARSRRAAASIAVAVLAGAVLASCKEPPAGAQPIPVDPTTTTTAKATTTTTTTTRSTTQTATATIPPTAPTTDPGSQPTPPPSNVTDYPSPGSTGVPAGTNLTVISGNYTAKTPGQVIDAKHITGALIIEADGVIVKRSQIDDSVINDTTGTAKRFSISDSLVGPAKCGTPTWTPNGIGMARYTATRVHVRGHEDGFRASGPDVTIRDSYFKACTTSSDAHADGIQDYPAAQRLVLDHNTFDMAHLSSGYTAPVFVYSTGTDTVRITDNLAAGGVASFYLRPVEGAWVVTGNRAVANSWDYFPYETDGKCANIGTWSDNDIVTIDSNYNVTGTVKNDVPCPR